MKTEESDLITQIGPGTPMGRLLRHYWVPVLRSERVVAGSAPVRFRMFGEDLVAFRGADGKIGVLDEACPHRGASLAVGNVEGSCVRCIYHGWKIDTEGTLLEAPTHPSTAKLDKIPTGGHPSYEDGGMVWAWLGAGEAPPPPKLAFSALPEDQIIHATGVVKANWVQMLEGLWDTFHAQILHTRANQQAFGDTARMATYYSGQVRPDTTIAFDSPDLSVFDTDYGFHYRSDDDIKELNYHWIMPWYVHHTVGPDPLDDKAVQIHVPIDDEHTLFWQVMYNRHIPLKEGGYARRSFAFFGDLNDFRKEFTPENRWLQDRAAMATGESFTGIAGGRGALQILMEDICIAEGQGRLDRTKETLGATDRVVVAGRKSLLQAVSSFEEGAPAFGLHADISAVEAVFNPKAVSA